MSEKPQRTEIIILDDDESVRAEIAQAVRDIFPGLVVREISDISIVMGLIMDSAARIFMLISDGQMNKGVGPDGADVTYFARQEFIPHVVLYSINTPWMGEMVKSTGVTCIQKPHNTSKDHERPQNHEQLKAWLKTICSGIPPQ
ncbi:hypothetical protein HZC21_01510 [Candidatus Peregrinibacteria bacterium]|nr:hypothetical protein [Candidatus Peregrinibacteria bacterium]